MSASATLPDPAPPRIGHRPSWLPLWLGVAGVSLLGLVAWFKPDGQSFYPRCFLYVTTGIQCPGCGATRATHALLRGDWGTAWRLNPFWVSVAPLMAWSYLAWLVDDLWRWRWPQPLGNRYVLAVLLGLAGAFGVARNLPVGLLGS